MFLGEDLLAWLVLAIGAALALGTLLALVRPRPDEHDGELARPPLGRSLLMIAVGTIAAVWGLAAARVTAAAAPLLEVCDLTVDFGGVRAVDGVSFEVKSHRLHGLIGPNGAGKTTTLDALTGFVPHGGRIEFEGRDLAGLAPHDRARAGLVRTFQSLELFDDLTVRENCLVAGTDHPLEQLGLQEHSDRLPKELSLGHRKLVAVARALASRPRLVLLDEPAAGLDTAESVELGRALRALVEQGTTVLLIDHDMGLVLGVCDEVTVLDFGRVLAAGTPGAIRTNPAVIDAYLGEPTSSTRGSSTDGTSGS